MAGTSRLRKPTQREVLPATVVRSTRITPRTVRVTIGGPDLARFRPLGFDQWFRLFIQQDGQDTFRKPSFTGFATFVHLRAMPKSVRPLVRNYTVRAYRADPPEIDIDVIVHDGGVASAWATKARPGEPVAVLDEGIGFAPPPDTAWILLVCDESGLPAVAGVCASLPADASGEAFIEVPDAADIQEISVPPGVRVHWLSRDDPDARPGALALATATATADLPQPGTNTYAFVVGESSMVTSLRRHLVNERSVPKENISFGGYWRHDAA